MRKERIFWGVLLILGSISLIVNKLGYFGDINMVSIIISIVLIGIMIKSIFYKSFAGILFPLAFICIIFDDKLGLTAITPWTVLIAAALGSAGLSMIFHKKPKWYDYKQNYNWKEDNYDTIDFEDDNRIRLDTSFGGSIKYINTESFERADLSCSFGSMKIYFDNSKLKNGRGVIKLEASFAGVELYIPKTWTVEDRTSQAFGGLSEKNKNFPSKDDILTLVGDISFAGVEIIYI
ncbi:LiaF transmembrane domain-containing protein [Romboutsia sp. Marseille-P6047]|uniref:LiaF transmembrane domain-containing protein n=1 Tax=Romboutsia sp. Marseille-P6047 TaxID=2161817 RepID=UPI000F059B12|nr:hypothetical protein [Romboutsia sp. Marseille-P6047]